jgi:hypothetical protein
VPNGWLEESQGLTNYVLALEKVHRWNVAVHRQGRDPFACVTFNYDLLLEDAAGRVFGHSVKGMDAYTASDDVHLYKPHGSVTWRRPATLPAPVKQLNPGPRALSLAIDRAAELAWDRTDTWAYVEDNDLYMDGDDRTKVWLPALSAPIRNKADFSMPVPHRESLLADLKKVTTLVAIGWRGRENHFLRLLQEHLPSAPSRLVVVSVSDDDAHETVDRLWQTGRFDKYAVSGIGFSGFVETPVTYDLPRATGRDDHTPLTLDHVLTARKPWGVWTERHPGPGLPASGEPTPYPDRGYAGDL